MFGVVTQAGADAIPDSLKEILIKNENQLNIGNRWLSVVLVGEGIGNRFERGVAQYPTADDEVHLVTIDDLEIVYGGLNIENVITVGQISASESLPAQIDINKMVTRHSAILGSTGSGKSNAVSIILEQIAKNQHFKSERIIVIDPHGEYNDSLSKFSKVYKIDADASKGQSELTIPFWALPFDELISIFSGRLNDTQKDYVRKELIERKIASSKRLTKPPNVNAITSDSPIPFDLHELWFTLDDFERQTFTDTARSIKSTLKETGNARGLKSNIYPGAGTGNAAPYLNNRAQSILSFLNSVKNRILDERFKFLFQISDFGLKVDGTIVKDLDKLLSDWIGHDKPITILDLSGMPSEIMVSVSGAVLKVIYDSIFWGQNLEVGGRKQPLLIVLEEAHNYLKAGDDSIASRTVQTIAKEGRKYGAGLMLVTQRPSELDETVLSQCGSVIALRMTNGKDRAHVSSSIQDDLQDLASLLPSLRTGEALVMGEMVRIPSRIKFDKIGRTSSSSDPKVVSEWKKERPGTTDYEKVIDLWRNGRFN
ncbi:MAG: ATP-binding protein [Cyclobacteriaceae bacterium]